MSVQVCLRFDLFVLCNACVVRVRVYTFMRIFVGVYAIACVCTYAFILPCTYYAFIYRLPPVFVSSTHVCLYQFTRNFSNVCKDIF